MADVFISYSRKDHRFVEKLAGALNTAGHDVWIDVLGIALHFASILYSQASSLESR